jgi:ABC-type glycerol-3-phosphate transport system substrate-binding protein
MRRKTIDLTVQFLLIFITGSFIYSCKSEITENLNAKEIIPPVVKAQINWIGQWTGEGDKEMMLRQIANEYEFLNQEIKVNLKFKEELYKLSDESQFLIDQIKKPVADYDIVVRVHVNYSLIATALKDPNWGEKYLVDFSKVPGFLESHKSFINSDKYKKQYGIYFGPYNEGQICALYVNTEVAKKMGITVKQYGMTFDDFLGYLKQAYEYNRSHSYITPIFEDAAWIQTEMIFKSLFYSLMDSYDEVLDTKLTSKKMEALDKCYQALDQMAKYEPIIKNRTKMDLWSHTDYILQDSCLFFVNYTFIYNFWEMKGVEKMKKILPCELPVFKPSNTYIGGYVANWAVLKNAPHKDEAIKLLMYWCTPAIAENWVRLTKCPSGVKGNMTSNSLGSDQFESYMYEIDKKYGDKLVMERDEKYIIGDKNINVLYHVIDVLEGRLSGKQAFNQLKKQLTL